MTAGADELLAAILIAVSWFLLSRALLKSCRSDDESAAPRSIDNRFLGEIPAARGPVNARPDALRRDHLTLDQM